MKESDNLSKTESIEALPEVSPEEEKEILTSLKLEAAHFIPDQLLSIMKACGLAAEITPDDENIVRALEGESQAFVPHDLGAVKKATGTFNPYLDQEALATQEKLHNEGAEIVPNVEKKVYAETGAKKHFSFVDYFHKHWIGLTSGVAVAAAALAVIIVVPNVTNQTVASGTYVAMTITPASYAASRTGSLSAYSSSSVSYYNQYQPSWEFSADTSNILTKDVTPVNYSAKLVGATITSGTKASEAAAKLISPSYSNGYLQNIDRTTYNQITITVLSTDANYGSKYSDEYKKALNTALSDNQVYAQVQMNVVSLSDSLKGVDSSTAAKIVRLYAEMNPVNSAVTLDALKAKKAEYLTAVSDVLNAASTAAITPRGLTALKEGLALTLIGVDPKSVPAKSDYETMRRTLIDHAGALPWGSNTQRETIQRNLSNDAYYVVGDSIAGTDTTIYEWQCFTKIRSYIISHADTTAEMVSLLGKVKDLVNALTMPDGYGGNERPDQGGHPHGQPGDNWGGGIPDGGWDFHPEGH